MLTVAAAMLAVVVAAAIMWLAYRSWIKPDPIHFTTGYVPYAGVVFMTAGLERFLEPLSQVLLPSGPAKRRPPPRNHRRRLWAPTRPGMPTPVNSFLDLAITGLTIGAGTKPLHDLITNMQVKASSAA